MAKAIYITEEGLQKIKRDFEQMVSVDRPAITREIAEAREKGDLSENAEYDAAKEAQGLLEMRISRLENMIANARIIDESKIEIDTVQILNKVKIKNMANNKVFEYLLVSESEADLKAGKIAINTPIAKGLLGKKVGDVVTVKIPAGSVEYKIMNISR